MAAAAIAEGAGVANSRSIMRVPATHQGQGAPRSSPTPVAPGPRGERVLSLVLTLEALRAAPGVLDPHKV